MPRVTLKNTFLTVAEDEEVGSPIQANFRGSASPRSRSLDCSLLGRDPSFADEQIEKLNKILDVDSASASPAASSPRSERPGFHSPPEVALAPLGQNAAGQGPSVQELNELQRRLEQVCQSRPGSSPSQARPQGHMADSVIAAGRAAAGARSGKHVPKVSSACSVSTLASDSADDGEMALRSSKADGLGPFTLSQESGSFVRPIFLGVGAEVVPPTPSEIGSIWRGDNREADPSVEFDMTIEESPTTLPKMSSLVQSHLLQHPPHHLQKQYQHHESAWAETEFANPRARTNSGSSWLPRCSSNGSWADSIDDDNDEMLGASGGAAQDDTNLAAAPNSAPPSAGYPCPTGESPRGDMGVWGESSSRDCSPRGDMARFGGWRTLPKEYRHGHVPKNLDLADKYKQVDTTDITTLMIRNLPNRYTQRELIGELEDLGFAGAFDFLYIPLDKGTMSNVGYAFVNFVDSSWASKCMVTFQNYRFKRHRKISGKIAAVSPAHIQGLEANLAHYEHAAVNTAKLKQRRPVVIANISKTLASATK